MIYNIDYREQSFHKGDPRKNIHSGAQARVTSIRCGGVGHLRDFFNYRVLNIESQGGPARYNGGIPPLYAAHQFWEEVYTKIGRPSNPLILEFGTSFSMSTCYFLYYFGERSKIFTYDMHRVNLRKWKKRKSPIELSQKRYGKRLQFIRSKSIEARKHFAKYKDHPGGKLNIVFVDAGHEYEDVRNDVDTAIELNIPWIMIDNLKSHEEIKRAVDEFIDEGVLEPSLYSNYVWNKTTIPLDCHEDVIGLFRNARYKAKT